MPLMGTLPFFEGFFAYAADGANPRVGNIRKSRAGRYAAVGIADGRVVDIATNAANILVH